MVENIIFLKHESLLTPICFTEYWNKKDEKFMSHFKFLKLLIHQSRSDFLE